MFIVIISLFLIQNANLTIFSVNYLKGFKNKRINLVLGFSPKTNNKT